MTPAPEEPLVIGLFNDHNRRSLLWWLEPVPPETIALSPETCRELHAWAEYFADRMTDNGWAADADAAWYEREGERLAQHLADELGCGIAIDYRPVGSDAPRRFASDAEPSHPEAAAALRAIAIADRRARAVEAARNSTGGWSARAPLSGETFRPDGV